MEYIEQAKKEIRDRWFENHTIKSIEGKEGFQRISWGEKGTRMYQVDYVLSDNMVFITGDLGDAAYSLTCRATLKNIKDFDLHYFTGKLTAHERSRWDFDGHLAQNEIDDYIFDWRDISHLDQLDEDESELYEELLSATRNWNTHEHFKTAIYSIYERTNVEWFDSEAASCIAECGMRLPYCFIAYWLGLQMIVEQLESKKVESA
ncbi:hypothetical protein [Paenibacillus illinoisensis]|uniref:hypothetical protein n=1 Tax=Paenibacillus illinoisensis TaxID=59845 RepID=UPI00301D6B46